MKRIQNKILSIDTLMIHSKYVFATEILKAKGPA